MGPVRLEGGHGVVIDVILNALTQKGRITVKDLLVVVEVKPVAIIIQVLVAAKAVLKAVARYAWLELSRKHHRHSAGQVVRLGGTAVRAEDVLRRSGHACDRDVAHGVIAKDLRTQRAWEIRLGPVDELRASKVRTEVAAEACDRKVSTDAKKKVLFLTTGPPNVPVR
jgi:hypothetical protein